MTHNNQNLFEIILRAFKVLDRSVKKKALISLVLSIINAGVEACFLVLVFPLILRLSDKTKEISQFELPLVGRVFSFIKPENQILIISSIIVGFIILKNLIFLVQTWWQMSFVRKSSARLSYRLLRQYMNAPYLWHLEKNTAELQRNVNGSIDGIFNRIIIPTLSGIMELCLLTSTVSVLLYIDYTIVLISTGAIFIAGKLYLQVFNPLSVRMGAELELVSMSVIKSLLQPLGAIKETRLFGCEDILTSEFKNNKVHQAHILANIGILANAPRAYLEMILALIILFSFLWVSSSYQNAEGIAVLGVFVIAAFRLLPSVGRVMTHVQNIKSGVAPLNNVETDLLAARESNFLNTLPDKIEAREESSVQPKNFQADLKLKDIVFSFPQADTPTINGVTLTIKKGECIGLVGESGSGKSTLVDILLGFLEPSEGAVFIDDRNITGLSSYWQGIVGYVPQSVYLVDSTIRENIAFGVPVEEIDEEAVKIAIKKAQIHDFIDTLRDGLDTVVGERGVRLSGGQRQRICIARALYRNPDIIVMDEGTSALDGETESKLTMAIETLRGEKTIILIAHRLSTVKECDRLFLMDAGQIVGEGSFEELASNNKAFTSMLQHAGLTSQTSAKSKAQ